MSHKTVRAGTYCGCTGCRGGDMKVWCSRDDSGRGTIWPEQPEKDTYFGVYEKENVIYLRCPKGSVGALLFPMNIKPGGCKQVTIKRWEVDDGG